MSSDNSAERPIQVDSDSAPEPASSARGSSREAQPPTGTPSKKRRGCQMLWGELEGHGSCKGSNQLPCYFGKDGHAASAGPDGRCDLCSSECMLALHREMPQRLTHLLTQLEGKPLQHALVRVKIVLGEDAKNMYEKNRARALHRRDPDRPTRGPRTRRGNEAEA